MPCSSAPTAASSSTPAGTGTALSAATTAQLGVAAERLGPRDPVADGEVGDALADRARPGPAPSSPGTYGSVIG